MNKTKSYLFTNGARSGSFRPSRRISAATRRPKLTVLSAGPVPGPGPAGAGAENNETRTCIDFQKISLTGH